MSDHEQQVNKSRIQAVSDFFQGRDILYTQVFLLPFYAAGFLDILFLRHEIDKNVAFMAALACLGIGGVLGFLFGIPQAYQSKTAGSELSTGDEGSNGSPTTRNLRRFQSNTNLEQVSDWLTKILIGAGLVQIQNLKSGLMHLAQVLATNLSEDGKSVAFSLFLIVYFLSLGFVSIYTITRLFLTSAFSRAEAADFEEFKSKYETKTRTDTEMNEGILDAMVEMLQKYTPPQTEGVSEDPNKGKYGGQPEANGRRLRARIVTKTSGTKPIMYLILFEVVSTDRRKPLSSPVTFILHPTYQPEEVDVRPKKGVASLWRMAWGAFTVAAITDGGKTRLELDLTQLPEAPQDFRAL